MFAYNADNDDYIDGRFVPAAPDSDRKDGGDEPGACAWGSGAYGRIGTVHIAVVDGEREECCTFA
jgi:hypothetical protein